MTVCVVSALLSAGPLPWTSGGAQETMDTSTTMSKPGAVLRRVCVVEILFTQQPTMAEAESQRERSCALSVRCIELHVLAPPLGVFCKGCVQGGATSGRLGW